MLLSQFDPDKSAIINPSTIIDPLPDFPETVVSVFSNKLFSKLLEYLGGEEIAETVGAGGSIPIYKVMYNGKPIAFTRALVGAPSCIGEFEEVIALGAKRIILLGNCGVLDRSIEDCGIIIPTKAIRDEGTSYHYMPESDYVDVNKKYIPEFISVLEQFGYLHVLGIAWTTDAFYRETKTRVETRRAMGAVCVDMECAAMQAMCNFRDVEFFQYFYAGDNLDHSEWDRRSLSGNIRLDDKEKIALLAFELAAKIS